MAAAGVEPNGGGAPIGRGKGKGKGAPPPKAAASTATPKAKAKGGFAPNMKSVVRPDLWEGLCCLTAQRSDGSFEAASVAKELQGIKAGGGAGAADILARLEEFGPAAATALVLRLWGRIERLINRAPSSIEVQTVGSGRGDSKKVSETAEVSEADMAERIVGIKTHFVKQYEPACGLAWVERAEEWLASLGEARPVDAVMDGLLDEWFKESFEKRSRGRVLSPEEIRTKEEEQRRRCEALRQEAAHRAAHWRSLASRPVDGVHWEQLRAFSCCSGGSGGVVLAQVGDAEAVVLKPLTVTAVAETLAAEVAALLGVRVAASRVVSILQEEYFAVFEALSSATPMHEEDRMLLLTAGVKEFVAVMEFLPGCVLQGLEGQQALNQDTEGSVLRGIGSLIALDCVLNNLDRVPAIWFNDGNLTNIMVTAGGEAVGIDQQVNGIADAAGRERYFAAVRQFCRDAKDGCLDADSVTRIRRAIAENCGVELVDSQCQELLAGARSTFGQVLARREALSEALQGLAPRMVRTFGSASVDVGLSRLDLMLDFLQGTMEAVAKVMA